MSLQVFTYVQLASMPYQFPKSWRITFLTVAAPNGNRKLFILNIFLNTLTPIWLSLHIKLE